ncbi:MAG: histidine--tRNA ligase [Candidatus Margulisbacteria bacterium]|nr:histidine--tRNA ligase [Candidatus Margulisiibacteriota bacterium]
MKYSAPRGTQDILPEEILYWNYIEEKAARVFKLFNYQEIRTPIFEQTDLFSRSIGTDTDIVEKEMYTFQDKKGRSITLRPEETAPIVRAYLENNLGKQGGIQKLWYQGPMFRYEKPQAGRFRQFHQVGCEIIGTQSPLADAELIQLAVQMFSELGLKDLEVAVNSVGCQICRPVIREKLKSFLGDSLPHLCADCQRRFKKNPLRILDCKNKKCRHYLMGLSSLNDALCHECQDHFHSVLNYLDTMGIKYKHNYAMVRGLDYYTKTVFEVISKNLGAQDAVCGGGRYDNLVKELGGVAVPAVGFAFGMERTVMVLKEQNVELPKGEMKKVFFAIMGEVARNKAITIIPKVREKGFQVELDYDGKGLKAQLKRANKINADCVVIIGEEEVDKNIVQVKNMATGEQKELPFDKLVDTLCK